MRFVLLALIISFIVCSLYAQDAALGVHINLQTGLQEKQPGNRQEIKDLILPSVEARVAVPGVPTLQTGISIGYGTRVLLETTPIFPSGSFRDQTGITRELVTLQFHVPIALRWQLTEFTWINSGVSAGVSYLKVDETVSFFTVNNPLPVGQVRGKADDWAFAATPYLEIVRETALPLFLTAAVGFRVLQFDMDWKNNADAAPLLGQFLSVASSKFDMSGFFLSAGLQIDLRHGDD